MKTELFIHVAAEATWPFSSACWKGKSPVHHQLVGPIIRVIRLKWQVPLERNRNAALCVKWMAAATVKSPLVPRQTGTIISRWGKWNPWLCVKVLSANPRLPFMELGCATSSCPRVSDPQLKLSNSSEGSHAYPPWMIIFFLIMVWVVQSAGLVVLWQVTLTYNLSYMEQMLQLWLAVESEILFFQARKTGGWRHSQDLLGLVQPPDPTMRRC